MIQHLMERLVLDVVTDIIDDDGVEVTLSSDFSELGVDQLTMTYIVLRLEARLGVEVPSALEDARTVGELVAGMQDALRANPASLHARPHIAESPPTYVGRRFVGRPAVCHHEAPPLAPPLAPMRPRRYLAGR